MAEEQKTPVQSPYVPEHPITQAKIIDEDKIRKVLEVLGCGSVFIVASDLDHSQCGKDANHQCNAVGTIEAASHGFPMSFAQGIINYLAGGKGAAPVPFPKKKE